MNRLATFEAVTATLDLGPSGQAEREVTQLRVGDTMLANAVELTSWNRRQAQVIVCEQCGIEGCEPGGWIAPRRIESGVIWLPAFDAMAEGDLERREFRPPDYVADRGAVFMPPAMIAQLSSAVPRLQWPEALEPLRGRDVARLMQWEAPSEILGRFPADLVARRDDILAVADGELEVQLDALEALLSVLGSNDVVSVREHHRDARKVTFFLDTVGAEGWSPLVIEDGELRLSPTRGLVCLPPGTSRD